MNREKLKEFSKTRYFKPLLFFGFYFVFFAVIIATMQPSSNPINNEKGVNSNWKDITNNYEYLYEIETEESVITLEGKKYNNKNLFTKKTNDIIDSEVYTFYEKTSIKKDDTWQEIDNFILIDESFDDRLLDINHLKTIIEQAELIDTKNNFDESISEIYKYNDMEIEVINENNVLKKVIMSFPSYNIKLQFKNINQVNDFVVEK
ncbi:MAG TPA: hypothetical protein GXZ95_02735 [Mollicutes bacterium]|nr:hypothetical protein [Mollicutes bacterium]